MHRVWRLVDAVVLLLVLLLPLMVLLGAAERTTERTTLLFWVLAILPLLFVPFLWRRADPEERGDGQVATARRLAPDSGKSEALAEVVAPVVDIRRAYSAAGIPVVEGSLRTPPAQAFASLERILAPHRLTPLLEDQGAGSVRVIALPEAANGALRRRRSPITNIVLFLATVATTVWAGALHQGVNLLSEPGRVAVGVPYAFALLAILGVHEFGHYFTARRYGVDVTLPYFIPVPMGLGTFGAFIQMNSLIRTRRAVFDIGIAGPLAGLVVALPALYFGLRGTPPLADGMHTNGVYSGSSFLLAFMYQFANGGELGTADIQLSPVAFAGWIGLFITALNLMPVGQLDGGHIAYGLFGQRRARQIGVGAFLLMLGLGLSVWPGLLTWALLIALIAGFAHMPALDDVTPLDGKRFAMGGLALAIVVLTLMPLPAGMRGLMLDCPYM